MLTKDYKAIYIWKYHKLLKPGCLSPGGLLTQQHRCQWPYFLLVITFSFRMANFIKVFKMLPLLNTKTWTIVCFNDNSSCLGYSFKVHFSSPSETQTGLLDQKEGANSDFYLNTFSVSALFSFSSRSSENYPRSPIPPKGRHLKNKKNW